MLKTRLLISSWLFSFFCYIFITVVDRTDEIEGYWYDIAQIFLPYGYIDEPISYIRSGRLLAHEAVPAKPMRNDYISYGVRSYDIHEHGLIGRLWLPHARRAALDENYRQYPAVLYLGDASGGLDDASATAVAERGFIVFDLLYFGDDAGRVLHSPLPPHLIQIPIEYFGRAFNWLKQQPQVDGSRLGILGYGRGSEAAVLAAVHYEGVNAVILQSPSAVSWVGAGHSGQSAWTIAGEMVPYLSLSFWEEFSHWWRVQWHSDAVVSSDLYAQALRRLNRWHSAWLPVEHLQAPILMISGQDDHFWPSSTMADLLMKRLREQRFDYAYHHRMFPQAGHRFASTCGTSLAYSQCEQGHTEAMMMPKDRASLITFANGGTMAGNAYAARRSRAEIIAFLQRHLGGGEYYQSHIPWFVVQG